jgi:DUF1680 family protein
LLCTLAPVAGYATIRRAWRKGDVVTLDLEMPAERLYAHPNVRTDVGRTAPRRGPLIYCVEEADNPGGPVQMFEQCRSPRQTTDLACRSCLDGESLREKHDGGLPSLLGREL